jgi:hypothetical protein
MTLGRNGAIATLIRMGDYFVVTAGTGGPSFEYSPDAPSGAPVVGSVGALKGKMVYFDAINTTDLLNTFGTKTEEHLLGLLALPRAAREAKPDDTGTAVRKAVERWARLASRGTQWNGSYQNFHSEVLMAAGLELPLGQKVKLAISNLGKHLPGITPFKLGKDRTQRINIVWDLVIDSLPEPEPI